MWKQIEKNTKKCIIENSGAASMRNHWDCDRYYLHDGRN